MFHFEVAQLIISLTLAEAESSSTGKPKKLSALINSGLGSLILSPVA